MLNAHTQLALARACTDLLVRPGLPLRVWLRLQAGATAAHDLAGYTGLRDVFSRHATGLVAWHDLASLAAEPSVDDLDLAEPLRLERMPPRRPAGQGRASAASAAAPAGALLPSPADASEAAQPVLGLIDTGLPFAHLGLRQPGVTTPSTRMQAIWDQDPAPDFGAWGRTPAPFGYGAVLSQDTMHQLMRSHASEADVYAAAGHGTVAARRTHGAHTLGLLAMHGAFVDSALGLDDTLYPDAVNRPVLGVQLPRALLDSPSRAGLCGAVLDGLLWMRAVCPGRRLRVAIPFGSTLGPHDGSSLFEQALDALIRHEAGRLEVFLPSGNSYTMQLHASVSPAEVGAGASLLWRVPPESEAASFVELWLPAGMRGQLDLLAPDGRPVLTSLGPGDKVMHEGADPQAAVSGVSTMLRQVDGGVQQSMLLRFGPTRAGDSGRAAAAPGDWCLRLHSLTGSGDGEVHAYGNRGRGSFGAAVRAQQARLLAPHGSRWAVHPLGSLSGMATGQLVSVIGGYIAASMRSGAHHLLQPARYTASGDGRNGRRVDTALASDGSASLRGVRSAGTLSAISWRMDGSSVAVPQAVRVGVDAPTSGSPPKGPHARLGWPVVP